MIQAKNNSSMKSKNLIKRMLDPQDLLKDSVVIYLIKQEINIDP